MPKPLSKETVMEKLEVPMIFILKYSTTIIIIIIINRSDKRKTEAVEMRFLRLMVGYTLWDKKRSSNIREQLGIFNINNKLT